MTELISNVTQERDTSTGPGVTLSRAHALLTEGCHGVTRDKPCDVERDSSGGRDSDIAPLRCDDVTITPATTRSIGQDKARFAKDPRFAQWVAGELAA